MTAATISPPAQLASGSDEMIVAADLALSPRAAFAHFVEPALLTLWWPPEAYVEPRPGGQYRLTWPSMNWVLFGQFTLFEPDSRLAFTWQWAHRPELPVRTVDVRFLPIDSGCRVVVAHGVYGDTAAEQEDRQGHIDGWLHFLGQLQAVEQHDQT